MKNYVLFVSAGRTDLKLLVSENGKVFPIAISRNTTRVFHQWLVTHPDKYAIEHGGVIDGIPLYQQAERNWEVDVAVDGAGQLQAQANKPTVGQLDIQVDATGRLLVIPVKLGRIVAELQSQQGQGKINVVAVVVFNTHRENRGFAKDEPFACGPVLSRWLAGCFALEFSETQTPGTGHATWVDLLQGNETLETAPEAINRLSRSLHVFSKEAGLCAALCGVGGIPLFKSLIHDSAYFYFPGRCYVIEDAEQQTHDTPPVLQAIGHLHITAEQSFALRANVAKLIAAGEFLGAEAAVRHVQDNEHLSWVNPIRTVASLFRGFDIKSDEVAGYGDLGQVLRELCGIRQRCLLPALRTEAALQAQAWTEAMHWTSAFYDAALLDAIEKLLDGWGKSYCARIEDREVVFYKPHFSLTPRPKGEPEIPAIPKALVRPALRQVAPYRYELDAMGANEDWWAGQIAVPAIKGFKTAFNKGAKNATPAWYRNKSAHSVLTADDLGQAIAAYTQGALWRGRNNDDKPETLYFLRQPLTVDILAYLDVAQLHVNYRALIKGLLEAMQSHQF